MPIRFLVPGYRGGGDVRELYISALARQALIYSGLLLHFRDTLFPPFAFSGAIDVSF